MEEVAVQNYSSQFYQKRYSGWGLAYHTYLITWLLQHAHGEILDAGCGTGLVSQLYPDLHILGIDLSEGMLAQNSTRCQKLDVCHLPKEWNATYDFVLCRSLLHHLPDHLAGLSEMHRVLKPQGSVAFLETNQSFLAGLIRFLTQHGDRFSEYHHSFKDTDLLQDIRKWFEIDHVRYLGYLAYPCFGFPDILPLEKFIPFKSVMYPFFVGVDEWLSTLPWIKRLSWAIGIQAHKP